MTMDGMHHYEVGGLYNPACTSWPDASQLRLSPAGCELILFFPRPTAQEVRAVQAGIARFAVVALDRALILCYRFEPGIRWSDAVYEAWRAPEHERGMLAAGPREHLLFTVMLVDSATGILRAIRVVTWPGQFANSVREAVSRQLAVPPDFAAAQEEVAALYQRYPDTGRMVRERADRRCVAGAGTE